MPQIQDFRLPDAGEGLTEAEIVTWKVGPVRHPVKVNDPVVEVETAKSLVELPCPVRRDGHRTARSRGRDGRRRHADHRGRRRTGRRRTGRREPVNVEPVGAVEPSVVGGPVPADGPRCWSATVRGPRPPSAVAAGPPPPLQPPWPPPSSSRLLRRVVLRRRVVLLRRVVLPLRAQGIRPA